MNRKRLLIIDDNKSFVAGLLYYYRKFFKIISIAYNKKMALTAVREEDIDTAIVDLMLDSDTAKHEGLDVIKEIKLMSKDKIKIIVLTAVEDQSVLETVKSDKSIVLFKKPVDIAALDHAVLDR